MKRIMLLLCIVLVGATMVCLLTKDFVAGVMPVETVFLRVISTSEVKYHQIGRLIEIAEGKYGFEREVGMSSVWSSEEEFAHFGVYVLDEKPNIGYVVLDAQRDKFGPKMTTIGINTLSIPDFRGYDGLVYNFIGHHVAEKGQYSRKHGPLKKENLDRVFAKVILHNP